MFRKLPAVVGLLCMLLCPASSRAHPLQSQARRLAAAANAVEFVSFAADPCGMVNDGIPSVPDGGGLYDVSNTHLDRLTQTTSIGKLEAEWNSEKPGRPVSVRQGKGWVEVQIGGLADDCVTAVDAPAPWDVWVAEGEYVGFSGLQLMFGGAGMADSVVDTPALSNVVWESPPGGASIRDILVHNTRSPSPSFSSSAGALVSLDSFGGYLLFVQVHNTLVVPLGDPALAADPAVDKLLRHRRVVATLRKQIAAGEHLDDPKKGHFPQLLLDDEEELARAEERFREKYGYLPD